MLPALTALLAGAIVAGGATLLSGGSTGVPGDGGHLSIGLSGERSSRGDLERPATGSKSGTKLDPDDPGPPAKSAAPPPTTTTVAPTTTTTTPPAAPTTEEPPPEPPPAAPDATKQARVLQLVNTARGDAGCGPLTGDAQLDDAAQKHAADMSNRDYFSHDTPEGVTFDQRIRNAGYDSPGAENIARGASTAEQVMDLWMNSDGHRRNILNCDLKTLGVGLDTDGFYWVQDFGF